MADSSPTWVVIIMNCIKTVVAVFDLVTLPIHLIVQQPWKNTRITNKVLMKQENTDDPYSPYTCADPLTDEQKEYFEKIPTVIDLFNYSVEKFGDNRCQGARVVFSEDEEIQPNGKVFKKFVLGDYEWKTYRQVQERVTNFGQGLRLLGVEPRDKVLIFADTCPEWLVAALACFQHNISVVTLYSTLGEEGIIHGINDTEVPTLITSQDLLPKLKKILTKTPSVKNIIFFEKLKRYSSDSKNFISNVNYHTFDEIESNGKDSTAVLPTEKPTGNSIAIIMFTSGSTGMPKAVLLSHKNIINATISSSVYGIGPSDTYIAFLPLAHVLELQAECMVMIKGIPIGYSSPLTLNDMSSKLKKGCPGDVTLLKPTFMASVPMILERVKKAVTDNIAKQNPLVKALFHYAIDYKKTYYEFGFDTPIINRLVCSKLQKLLGGHLRMIGCGGAPLSEEVHAFIKTCFNVKVLIGYGLTETCSANTTVRETSRECGHVGAVIPGSYLKLADWEEGNYKVTDKPNPRGEIIIGGDSVSDGYFNNQKLTDENFETVDGIRWFKSGDIGEVLPNGNLKIIDRKKDIVKLQTGEYISLVKIETIIKELSVVDNVCVVANSLYSYVVALIVPNSINLAIIAEKLGKVNSNHNVLDHNALCRDRDVINAVTKSISEHCLQRNLVKFEIPQKVLLCEELWTPDTGIVTSTFKLKRKALENRYKSEISKMF